MTDQPPPYLVQSADHVLRLLEELVRRRSLRLGEAARFLAVAPSTAHRLLRTLCHRGFVTQPRRGGVYLPGPALTELATATIGATDIQLAVRPTLERLREQLQETVSLLVLVGNHVRFVDSIEGPRTVRVASRVGLVVPAHATSGGLAMLAVLPPGDVEARYPARVLPPVSAANQSVSTWDHLLRDLAATRRRGYGVNFAGADVDVSGVGVCVRDRSGSPVAAIAAACPTSRLNTLRGAAVLAPVLTSAATAVESCLHGPLAAAAGPAAEPAHG